MFFKNTCRQKFILGVIVSCALILPLEVFAGNGHGGCNAPHGEYTVAIFNCIKGKVLHPQITYSNVTPAPTSSSNIVLQGPAGSAQCGPGVKLIDDVYTSDSSHPGLVFISGLNGGTLILAGNIGHQDYITWPNGNRIPGRGWTWGTQGGMAVGFVSNRNYQRLPSLAKCPTGDQHGPICIDLHHSVLHTCFGLEQDPGFEIDVYIFSAPQGAHANLANLPSSVNQ